MQPFGKDPFKDNSEADISHRSEINETLSKNLKYIKNIETSVKFSGKESNENFNNE